MKKRPQDAGRERSVFINCPYDAEYRRTFEAIVFTVLSYGLCPRWASDTSRGTRLHRITYGLRTCRYSLHDLSRYKVEATSSDTTEDLLARFNMPLELGLALEQSYPEGDPNRDHEPAVMVIESSPYQRVISDLNAYDPITYDGTPRGVCRELSALLLEKLNCTTPTIDELLSRLQAWNDCLDATRKLNDGKDPNWNQMVACWESLFGEPWK